MTKIPAGYLQKIGLHIDDLKCPHCNSKENLSRHHVIPLRILSNIKKIIAKHQKLDFLCKECHQSHNESITQEQKNLEQDFYKIFERLIQDIVILEL